MDMGKLQTFRHICIISNLKTQKKKFVVFVGFEPEQARLTLQLLKVTFLASKYLAGASVLDTAATETRNLKDSVYRV